MKSFLHEKTPCSICQSSFSKKNGTRCSSCTIYFHLSCLKVSKKAASSISNLLCPACLPSTLHIPANKAPPVWHETQVPISPSAEKVLISISSIRRHRYVITKVPKAARILASESLAIVINDALVLQTPFSWVRVLFFPLFALGFKFNFDKTDCFFATNVKRNISCYMESSANDLFLSNLIQEHSAVPTVTVCSADSEGIPSSDSTSNLGPRIMAKLMEGDIRAAMRVLASDGGVLRSTEAVIDTLKSKHPPAPSDLRPFPPTDGASSGPAVNNEATCRAIRSFSPSSGLRPSHLRDLSSAHIGEVGLRLANSITSLINRILSSDIPVFARDLLSGCEAAVLNLRKENYFYKTPSVIFLKTLFKSSDSCNDSLLSSTS